VAEPVLVVGSYLSPYVRKVLVFLDLKGVPYRIDPIVPFLGDDRFSKLSPLRRVPVLVEGDLALSDSSVICQYLEDRHPDPPLYPADPAARARARWLEEYADTRLGEVFVWRLFNEVAIKPFVWGEPTDAEVVARTLERDVPEVLDYLESQLPVEGFAFGALSIADVSIVCFFRNAAFARFRVDPQRWPGSARYVERVLGTPPFLRLRPFEERLLRTPLAQHRAVLAELGAPLSTETLAGATPRRGVGGGRG
jgi:glutathione S-transferase